MEVHDGTDPGTKIDSQTTETVVIDGVSYTETTTKYNALSWFLNKKNRLLVVLFVIAIILAAVFTLGFIFIFLGIIIRNITTSKQRKLVIGKLGGEKSSDIANELYGMAKSLEENIDLKTVAEIAYKFYKYSDSGILNFIIHVGGALSGYDHILRPRLDGSFESFAETFLDKYEKDIITYDKNISTKAARIIAINAILYLRVAHKLHERSIIFGVRGVGIREGGDKEYFAAAAIFMKCLWVNSESLQYFYINQGGPTDMNLAAKLDRDKQISEGSGMDRYMRFFMHGQNDPSKKKLTTKTIIEPEDMEYIISEIKKTGQAEMPEGEEESRKLIESIVGKKELSKLMTGGEQPIPVRAASEAEVPKV